jgi:hypothetical protein
MRTFWWGCIAAAVLMMCWGAYQHVNQSALPTVPPGASEQSEQRPLDQSPEQPVAEKDDSRLQQADAVPERPEQPVAEKDDDRLQQADAAPARPEQPAAEKDDSRLQHAVALAPPDLQVDQLPKLQKEARLEDPAGASAVERSEPSITRQNLSYLHYYAYSELPPETKPADTVLNALKDIPSGTPVEEIRRVADLLGMDFTFLKAIAKIESGFDPKQRTGSYIGLFQLSKYEFKKHGSGDILVARDNAVAAALKMMNEAVLFQMITRRKTTQFDLYLIHQQGIEGAAEHMSHPNRLAWRSMCKTQEGKQKGERWCKLAIWGNTLPTLKRTWKSVNNVTSGAFVAMWQQRVSHFYGRYSQTAAAID